MAWLQLATPMPLDWYQAASCTHASRKLSGLPHPTAIMWLSPLIFSPPHCSWLEHSSWSGPLPLTYSGVWFTDNPICMLLSWYSTELRPYHEEPRFSFSCFLLLSFVAPLLCFCCSLHSTPSITWPVYYRLGVFNILKSSRNLEEEDPPGVYSWIWPKRLRRFCHTACTCQTWGKRLSFMWCFLQNWTG